MNKIYKSVWCEKTGTYVAASESTKSRGKKAAGKVASASAVVAALLSGQAMAYTAGGGTSPDPDAVVIGTSSQASGTYFVGPGAIGAGNLAINGQTVSNVAIGESAVASNGSVAVGDHAQTATGLGTAIGTYSLSGAMGGTAFGAASYAAGQDSSAFGYASRTNQYGDVALGVGAKAGVDGAPSSIMNDPAGRNAAIGSDSRAYGGHAVAAGTGSKATALNATAFGGDSQATATNAAALGATAKAMGTNSAAVGAGSQSSGANSAAIGAGSQALADNSAAIGAGATVTVANSAAIGANSTTTSNLSAAAYVPGGSRYPVAGLAPAGEVSIGEVGSERRLTNVAAGSADTDGVNVSQLKSLAGAGMDFAGNSGSAVHRDLGQTLAIKGAATTAGTYSGANLKTVTDPVTGAINLQMADAPKFGTVTINDSGSGKITGLTAGTADTDGVNVKQLKDEVGASKTHYYSVNDNGVTGANYNNDGATGINALAAGVGASATQANAVAMGNGAKATVADGVALGSGANATRVAGMAGYVPSGAIAADSAAIAATVATRGAMDVGSRQITGVAAGTSNSDAVNVSQLKAVENAGLNFSGNSGANVHRDLGDTLAIKGTALTTGTYSGNNLKTVTDPTTGAINLQMADAPKFGTVTINDGGTGKITGLAAGVADTDGVNVRQLKDEVGASKTHYYSVNDNGVTGANYNNDGATGVNALAAGVGASATQTNAVAMGNGAKATVADGVALGSGSNAARAAGMAGYAPSAAAAADKAAIAATVGTRGAVDVGSRQITGVAAGTANGDAVNVAQLKSVENLANAGWNVADGSGTKANIGPNGKVTFTGDTNVSVAAGGANDAGTVAVTLNKNLDLGSTGSVTVGASKLDNTGLTITGGPSVTNVGINAGSKVITNVATGVAGTDAVNVDQLTKAKDDLTKAGMNFAGNSGATVDRDLGQTLAIKGTATTAGSYSGGNLKTVTDPTTGAINLQMADAPKFGTVTINDGGSGKITGLTAGTADTDGVNVKQLKDEVGASKTHYYSVNDNGVTGANYNNDGATGVNALAAGVGASATQTNAVAMGNGARATVADGVALGSGSNAARAAGMAGYAPSAAAAADKAAIAATVGTRGAVDVGSRQITGVAAGTANGDAVNVAQLKSVENLANAGWNVADGSGTKANIGPNGKVTFTGDSNVSVAAGGADDAGTVAVTLNKNLDLTSTGSVTVGASKLDNTGLSITGGPSVTNTGINAGSKVITNVATGVAGTDAVNVDQLTKARTDGLNFSGNSGANVHRDLGDTLAIKGIASTTGTYSGNNLKTVTDTTTGAINLQMADAPKFGTVTINDGGSGKITGLTAGVADTDAVNVSQLNAVDDKASLGWNMQDGNGGAAGNVAPGDTVKLANGSNTKSYYDAATKTMHVDVVNNPTFSGMVTMNGGMTVGAGQNINMGGNQVHNVQAGTADADAVNVSQLKLVDNKVTNLDNRVTNVFGDDSDTNINVNGRGIRYVRTNDAGLPRSDAFAQGYASTAVGYGARSTADDTVAIGHNARASAANSVALGANSTTTAILGNPAFVPVDASYAVAGLVPAGEVSVGAKGSERRVTNVAAGSADTDAVNVSQLKAVNSKVTEIDQNAVKYDVNPDGTINYNSVTMGGTTYNSTTKTGGTKITNVARGVNDSDAVNMSQLNETNQAVTNITDTVNNFAGDQSDSYTTINGRGIRYVRTNDAGLPLDDAYAKAVGASALGYNAMALGVNALAMGRGARANFEGDVALGSGSKTAAAVGTAGTTIAGKDYAFAGAAPTSTVSVGDVGAERTITNVAAGRITAESTDAINGSQLYATNQAIENLDRGSVKYEQNADGTYNYNTVVMQGDTYNSTTKTGGTRIKNVAAGVDGGDAVNVDQLNEVKQDVTNVTNTVNNFAGNQTTNFTEENGRGIKYVRTNDTGLEQDDAHDAHAQGTGSTAVGYNATAGGESAVAIGRDSQANKTDAVAMGHGAQANANDGDVALGSGSKTAAVVATEKVTIAGNEYKFAGTNPTSTVSVGDVGAERTITNVAAGRISAESTDAVNGSQLYATNQAIENINSEMGELEAGAVKYKKVGDTIDYNTVVMQGDTYNSVTKTGGTKITNVARGVDDSDAVNMSQLNETNQAITNVNNTVNNFAGDQSTEYTEKNGRGIRYVRTNDTGLTQSDASAQGQGSTAVGYDAKATGESALALGRNAQASEANSVALGSGSKTAAAVATASGTVGGTTYQFAGAKPTSTVSVGDKDAERTVTNVAAGRISAESTDAINGSQLYATNQAVDANTQAISNLDQRVANNTQSINSLNNKVDGVKRDANAGSASAMAVAGLPQAVLPGKGMVAMAGSTYGGESAMALGVSKLSDSGKWVFKGGVTTNTRGNVGATVGAGFHW